MPFWLIQQAKNKPYYIALNLDTRMTMDRRFVKAEIREHVAGAFTLTVTLSYYGLYEFIETRTLPSLIAAKDMLLRLRCCGQLQIIDIGNVVIIL